MAHTKILWNNISPVEIINTIEEPIIKISNIENHLYLLTKCNNIYHGFVRQVEELYEVQLELCDNVKLKDLDCYDNILYGVDINGTVVTFTDALEKIKDIDLVEDTRLCPYGHTISNYKLQTETISVGKYGCIFLTENGQLWAKGDMHEIGINSDKPKKVTFFEDRYVYSAGVGEDFAVAIVSKQLRNEEDVDSDCGNEDTSVLNCPTCLSTTPQLTSPVSLNSLSERCPSGIPPPASYDIETTSTSSKSDSSKCSTDTEIQNKKAQRNIIFRNTEAAKDFLTRQFTRMSSAGEEYLVECTEKPTRIIKENVTNVASFVYDKVATLSRHVSGSSETTEMLEIAGLRGLPRVTSKDEFSWSLSQATSDRENSEHGIQDRIQAVIRHGSNLLNCEVWTWGNIVHGQLGVGDIIKRERPMIITKLSNNGARKISVQCCHASVLTLDGRAFIWGRNDYNQVTVDSNTDQSSPKLLLTERYTERILDISCGVFHSAALTSHQDAIYFGKYCNRNLQYLYRKSKNCTTKENCVELEMNDSSDSVGPVSVLSTAQYSLVNVTGSNTFVTGSITQEQSYLENCLLVVTNLIKPLQKKNISIPESSLYEELCRNYIELVHFTAANVQSLLEFNSTTIPASEIIMIKYYEEYLYIYRSYLSNLYNVLSIGGASVIPKCVEISVALYKLQNDVTPVKRDRKTDELIVNRILLEPFKHLKFYRDLLALLINGLEKVSEEIVSIWSAFCDEQEAAKSQAEDTKSFWTSAGKVVEVYKIPTRRVLRDSRSKPIQLQNGSRFSTHWFILFNDVFVHVNGSTPIAHNLTTIWVEPLQDATPSNNGTHQISVKTPEDTMELYTVEAVQKTEWYHALQRAVRLALGGNSSDLSVGRVKVEFLPQPPGSRNTSYTFGKSGFLKDATYAGRWVNGKMHGNGRLTWLDGMVYKGQFNNNAMHGFGRMDAPDYGVYEGQWKDNKRNGFGILKYTNGNIYKGYFKDNLPHGHGSMKQGHFMASLASIYIGDWSVGAKNGYGIIDDIVTGEKYLGNWLDNKKHGNGLIVTADGVYYEGIFNQDVLTGHGIMILEDGTHYEGDFKGAGLLAGRGVLTLQTGHRIEGNLTGSYSEGIKISQGTLTVTPATAGDVASVPGMPKSLGTFCAPVHQKWRALFSNFYQLMGVPVVENGGVDVATNGSNGTGNMSSPASKVWQNVAVFMTNTHSGEPDSKPTMLESAVHHLDTIPQFGMESLQARTFMDLKMYLAKAFDHNYHPLGSLLTDLTVAYTATYGGLRAHPLLLLHAVIELHYIIKKIYDIVRLLFPALPIYGKELTVETDEGESETITFRVLLYPLILPRVYSSLFTLYTLKNKSFEVQYWRRLREWNKQPDYTLMVFLSVDKKFLNPDINDTITHDNMLTDTATYTDSIETLQQLKTTFSPIEKLQVIRQTFQRMTEFVQKSLGPKYRWNMDDLLPVFLYVVVRARIPQLGSEIDFIEDFIEPNLECGELSIMFTTLQACYQQILQEKVSIN